MTGTREGSPGCPVCGVDVGEECDWNIPSEWGNCGEEKSAGTAFCKATRGTAIECYGCRSECTFVGGECCAGESSSCSVDSDCCDYISGSTEGFKCINSRCTNSDDCTALGYETCWNLDCLYPDGRYACCYTEWGTEGVPGGEFEPIYVHNV